MCKYTYLYNYLLSILVCPLFLDILLCNLSKYKIYLRIFMILLGMPLICWGNCWVLQCVIWNAADLYTCLLIILLCLIFIDVLSCKSESHSFVEGTIILQCVMSNAMNFNTCLVSMMLCPLFGDILFLSQNVTRLLKEISFSTVFIVEWKIFEHFLLSIWYDFYY